MIKISCSFMTILMGCNYDIAPTKCAEMPHHMQSSRQCSHYADAGSIFLSVPRVVCWRRIIGYASYVYDRHDFKSTELQYAMMTLVASQIYRQALLDDDKANAWIYAALPSYKFIRPLPARFEYHARSTARHRLAHAFNSPRFNHARSDDTRVRHGSEPICHSPR